MDPVQDPVFPEARVKELAPLSKKKDGCRVMGLFLGPLLYSIGLLVCFEVSTRLLLLLWLCNIICSQVL
jgi:hypothetical protein